MDQTITIPFGCERLAFGGAKAGTGRPVRQEIRATALGRRLEFGAELALCVRPPDELLVMNSWFAPWAGGNLY